MRERAQYAQYKKPSWSPPSWLFAPVWTVLYIIIAASFSYVGWLYLESRIPFVIIFPFFLNLAFNFLFTPIQFGLKDNLLAAADIVLVLATLLYALCGILPYAPWVAYANIPYVLWVLFATVLQLTITRLNWKH